MAPVDQSETSIMNSIVTFDYLGHHGELGNQMFQVAATLGYARKHDKKLLLPLWRCYISGNDYANIFKNPLTQTHDLGNFHPLTRMRYMDLKFVDLQNVEGNVTLEGYFQSEKYFEHCKKEVKLAFQPTYDIDRYIQDRYADVISLENAVALHVRTAKRSKSDSPEVHACATREFIEKAMLEFDDDSTFVVFADVMSEAKLILPEGKKYFFVEGEANFTDLFMMTYFNKFILSPSTFGWWGAWLCKDHEGIQKAVIMKDWFVGSKSYLNDNDIVPSSWIKI